MIVGMVEILSTHERIVTQFVWEYKIPVIIYKFRVDYFHCSLKR